MLTLRSFKVFWSRVGMPKTRKLLKAACDWPTQSMVWLKHQLVLVHQLIWNLLLRHSDNLRAHSMSWSKANQEFCIVHLWMIEKCGFNLFYRCEMSFFNLCVGRVWKLQIQLETFQKSSAAQKWRSTSSWGHSGVYNLQRLLQVALPIYSSIQGQDAIISSQRNWGHILILLHSLKPVMPWHPAATFPSLSGGWTKTSRI